MALHLYPVTIRSISPPIQCLLSRPTTEFRCLHTIIYLHGLNGSRNQIFQDRYMEFAEAIQNLGCNLLSIELPFHGERRQNKEQPAIQNMVKSMVHKENNPFNAFINDIQKTVDFIIEKKITRPGEIGVVGLAWGATNAFYALKTERRIRCGVVLLPVCKISTLVEFKQLKDQPIIEQYEPLNYVDKIAPKPLLFVTGESDVRADPVFANELYDKLLPEYKETDDQEKLAYTMLLNTGHAFDSQMTQLTVDWCQKHLLGDNKGPSLLGD